MKRIISIILLLAMCVACFAGCAEGDGKGGKKNDALNSAAEYLRAMYIKSPKVMSKDQIVISQVVFDNKTYPITWTTTAPDNAQVVPGENNQTVIKIVAGEVDINFTLTATLKDEKGKEASVSFEHTIPAKAQVTTGAKVVLAYPKESKYITGSHYLYTGKNKWQLNLTESKADAIALEVVDNGDQTVTFKAGSQYLFCDANHVKFVSEQDDNTKFVLEPADTNGNYFIRCAVANYNGKAQYLEVYSGYLTCYGMGSDASIYTFKLEDGTGASGTISGLEETPAPDTNPPATNPPATNPPATNPPATNPPAVTTGASVTFDFTGLDKQGVEITADEALALFNSVASGGGLTGVTLTKIYNGNSTGGAHPDSAGFIRCGKSDVAGDLVLTFDKKVAKVEILCHDWYAKSAQYPTNTNQVAINGGAAQLAPYNETGAPASMVFNLDGSSNVVDFDFSNLQSGKTGRVFIFKMIVTFVG